MEASVQYLAVPKKPSLSHFYNDSSLMDISLEKRRTESALRRNYLFTLRRIINVGLNHAHGAVGSKLFLFCNTIVLLSVLSLQRRSRVDNLYLCATDDHLILSSHSFVTRFQKSPNYSVHTTARFT